MRKNITVDMFSVVDAVEQEAMVSLKASDFRTLLEMAKAYEEVIATAKRSMDYVVEDSTFYSSGHNVSVPKSNVVYLAHERMEALVEQLIQDDAAMEILVQNDHPFFSAVTNDIVSYLWESDTGYDLRKEFPEFKKAWEEAKERIAQCTAEERDNANNEVPRVATVEEDEDNE